ncbi:hypothetical protein QFZ48_003405 [Chitinophaga sp. W2I13]
MSGGSGGCLSQDYADYADLGDFIFWIFKGFEEMTAGFGFFVFWERM